MPDKNAASGDPAGGRVEGDQTFRAGASVSTRSVGDELIVLDVEQGEFFVCTGSGPQVWDMLTRGISVHQISRSLTERYGISEEVALRDVVGFVRAGCAKGLLVQDGN